VIKTTIHKQSKKWQIRDKMSITITVVGIISLLVLVAAYILLYINREGESVGVLLVKISGATLAVVAFLLVDLLRTPESMHLRTELLIIVSSKGALLSLDPVFRQRNILPWNAYSILEETWKKPNYSNGYGPYVQSSDVFNELIVATFLRWMSLYYSKHWQMEPHFITGISSGQMNSQRKLDRESETSVYMLSESGNYFLQGNQDYNNSIQLPSGSHVVVEMGNYKSTVSITNRNINFTFTALCLGGGALKPSSLGEAICEHLSNPKSYSTRNYILTLDVTFNRWFQWSPGTNRQREWLEQLFDNFEQGFSWELFKVELEQALDDMAPETELRGLPGHTD
jgi:hypothetical protein